ncbi:MAG: ATP-binding protein [Anaerolineales bacterium]
MPSPRSLRFQLPLSYAGIALVATLSLGAVLLFTVRGFYQAQERAYLQENALALSVAVSQMIDSGLPNEIIEAQVKSLSLLTLARIQVQNLEGVSLADSGVPDAFQITSLAGGGGPSQIFVNQFVVGNGDATQPMTDVVILRSDMPPPSGTPMPFNQFIASYPPPGDPLGGTGTGTSQQMGIVSFAAPAVGTLYGFNFSISADEMMGRVQIQRSEEHVTVPLINNQGQLIGHLELSEGPAYGREIVRSVARAWAVSGLLAVSVAAFAGGVISRRMTAPVVALTTVTGRMAEGDLSARATVNAPEELATLGQSFNEMAVRVEDMISTLRNFVSDAAHELHTPLTALRTDLELATETASPALISRALTQADRLKDLVDSLLNLSRIEAREHLHTTVNLTRVVRELAEMYASRAEQAGVSFTLSEAETPAQVVGNEMQLRSAVGNLLDNALKFTPEGGQVGLAVEEDETGWTIHVTDTGLGIPPEEIPLLFRRFHRARNVSDFPGNGLGLAIVKAIAEAHQGRVAVENLNPGARFSFWVPK